MHIIFSVANNEPTILISFQQSLRYSHWSNTDTCIGRLLTGDSVRLCSNHLTYLRTFQLTWTLSMSVVEKVKCHVDLSVAAVIYSFVMMLYRRHCLKVQLNLMMSSTTPMGMGGCADVWATRRLGDKRLGDICATFGRKLMTYGRQHLYDILWDFREKTIGPFGDKKSLRI